MKRIAMAALALAVLGMTGCAAAQGSQPGLALSPAAVTAALAACHHHCHTPPPTPTPTPTTPTPTPTTPTPTPTTPAPTPTPTSTGWTCTTSSPSGNCPSGSDYNAYPGITMSNGYNTYVANNCWADPSCKQVLSANGPGDWQVSAAEPAGNGSVMTGPELQQQTNNWCTSLNEWDNQAQYGCSPEGDVPLSALTSLTSSYAESMPHNSQTIAEWAYDVWTNYPSDVMFWTDTVNRCNSGSFGGTTLGTGIPLGGQLWDAYRYGGPGAEIIFVLEGSGGAGTCAQQPSGTVDILAGLKWLQSAGYLSNVTVSLIDGTFEICSTGGSPETFRVSQYALTGGA